MPRPRPLPENKPHRTTVSLPIKITTAALNLINPDVAERHDFSSVVEAALREYLARNHPAAIKEATEEIRAAYEQTARREKKVAEPPIKPDKSRRHPGVGPRDRVSIPA